MKIAALKNNEIFIFDLMSGSEISLGVKAHKAIKIDSECIIYLSYEDKYLYKKSLKNAEQGICLAPFAVDKLLAADSEKLIYLKNNKVEVFFKDGKIMPLHEKKLKNLIIL